MSQQKKAIITLIVIAVFFIGFIISGAMLDREDRPSPGQNGTEAYRNTSWGNVLEKPMAWFTPALSPESIHHESTRGNTIEFSIDGDDDHAFRSLKVMANRPQGWTKNSKITVFYTAPDSSDENLNKQKTDEPLEAGSADKESSTTFTVLKSRGKLEVTLHDPAQLRMKDGKDNIILCQRTANGKIQVGEGF